MCHKSEELWPLLIIAASLSIRRSWNVAGCRSNILNSKKWNLESPFCGTFSWVKKLKFEACFRWNYQECTSLAHQRPILSPSKNKGASKLQGPSKKEKRDGEEDGVEKEPHRTSWSQLKISQDLWGLLISPLLRTSGSPARRRDDVGNLFSELGNALWKLKTLISISNCGVQTRKGIFQVQIAPLFHGVNWKMEQNW